MIQITTTIGFNFTVTIPGYIIFLLQKRLNGDCYPDYSVLCSSLPTPS